MSSSTPALSVINTIAEDKVLKRIFELERIFDVALGRVNGIYLNRKLLRHAIESYCHDLNRMKDFHKIDFADQHKRAAFTMLWIVRAHPVQLHTDVNIIEPHLVINELFAVHAGLAHLKIASGSISVTYLRNLLYTLHYRPVYGELLASIAYLLECACHGKTP